MKFLLVPSSTANDFSPLTVGSWQLMLLTTDSAPPENVAFRGSASQLCRTPFSNAPLDWNLLSVLPGRFSEARVVAAAVLRWRPSSALTVLLSAAAAAGAAVVGLSTAAAVAVAVFCWSPSSEPMVLLSTAVAAAVVRWRPSSAVMVLLLKAAAAAVASGAGGVPAARVVVAAVVVVMPAVLSWCPSPVLMLLLPTAASEAAAAVEGVVVVAMAGAARLSSVEVSVADEASRVGNPVPASLLSSLRPRRA